MKATNISCYGDDRFKMLLSIVAFKRKMKVAELVRKALDTMYGDELAEAEKNLGDDVQASTSRSKDEHD